MKCSTSLQNTHPPVCAVFKDKLCDSCKIAHNLHMQVNRSKVIPPTDSSTHEFANMRLPSTHSGLDFPAGVEKDVLNFIAPQHRSNSFKADDQGTDPQILHNFENISPEPFDPGVSDRPMPYYEEGTVHSNYRSDLQQVPFPGSAQAPSAMLHVPPMTGPVSNYSDYSAVNEPSFNTGMRPSASATTAVSSYSSYPSLAMPDFNKTLAAATSGPNGTYPPNHHAHTNVLPSEPIDQTSTYRPFTTPNELNSSPQPLSGQMPPTAQQSTHLYDQLWTPAVTPFDGQQSSLPYGASKTSLHALQPASQPLLPSVAPFTGHHSRLPYGTASTSLHALQPAALPKSPVTHVAQLEMPTKSSTPAPRKMKTKASTVTKLRKYAGKSKRPVSPSRPLPQTRSQTSKVIITGATWHQESSEGPGTNRKSHVELRSHPPSMTDSGDSQVVPPEPVNLPQMPLAPVASRSELTHPTQEVEVGTSSKPHTSSTVLSTVVPSPKTAAGQVAPNQAVSRRQNVTFARAFDRLAALTSHFSELTRLNDLVPTTSESAFQRDQEILKILARINTESGSLTEVMLFRMVREYSLGFNETDST